MFDLAETLKTIPPHERINTALALVNAAIDTDPSELCDTRIDENLVAATRLAERTHALTVINTAVWEPRQTFTGGHARSARAWLRDHTTMSAPAIGVLLRTGRFVAAHDTVAKHLAAGELTCDKVEVLTRVVTTNRQALFERDQHILIGYAVRFDTDATERLLRRWQQLCDDELANDDTNSQHQRRRCHHSRVGNTWHTEGQSDLEDGAIINAALTDAMGDPDPTDRPGGARSTEQRRADALTAIARAWLTNRNRDHGNNPVAVVNVHINDSTLTGTSADGFDPNAVCDLIPGGPIPRDTARRLLCDSYVGRIIFGATGEILDQGRLKRLFTPAQKRAMIARDGPHCVVPRCPVAVEHC